MTDEQMLAVYRHDAHKFRGQSHRNAPDEMFGVPVNTDVPYGADSDAAAMSRPNGKPEQVLHGHETHYRRSLITGEMKYDPQSFSLQQYRSDLERLVTVPDAREMHRAWLQDRTVAWFNESVYQPYTSLKYHTLLVAALVANYREGAEFDDLALWVDRHTNTIEPHKTVFHSSGSESADPFQLIIDENDTQSGFATKLSSYPMRNFASVWGRLPTHPWRDRANDRHAQVIDSQLRRIQSWSTGLQYLENTLSNGENNA